MVSMEHNWPWLSLNHLELCVALQIDTESKTTPVLSECCGSIESTHPSTPSWLGFLSLWSLNSHWTLYIEPCSFLSCLESCQSVQPFTLGSDPLTGSFASMLTFPESRPVGVNYRRKWKENEYRVGRTSPYIYFGGERGQCYKQQKQASHLQSLCLVCQLCK